MGRAPLNEFPAYSKTETTDLSAGPSVLVIDRDPTIRKIIEFRLRLEHLPILSACDGHHGLELATRQPISLILLESAIASPRWFRSCRQLRRLTKAPVVLIGAPDNLAEWLWARLAGVRASLPRPFERADLLHVVRTGVDQLLPNTEPRAGAVTHRARGARRSGANRLRPATPHLATA